MSKKDKIEEIELVVIGSGPAGYAAAFKAADLGLKVTLIGSELNPGGTCLYKGCIPAKMLLELLKTKEEATGAEAMGLYFHDPQIDFKAILEWKKNVVNELAEEIGLLSEGRGISYLRGKARFVSKNEIVVDTHDGNNQSIRFLKAIIATGSVPIGLPGADFDHEKIIDSADAIELKELPASMLVIGGGFIGTELGSVYASLGCKVSIAEKNPTLLSWLDKDLIRIFNKQNIRLFEDVFLETVVEEVGIGKKKVKVSMKNKDDEWKVKYDLVLIAIGRSPITLDLNLDRAEVEVDNEGFIKVDQYRKTSVENIFAIGDITGKPMYADKASHEGRLVAEVIAGKKQNGFTQKAIPCVVASTRSEMAWCGLMEREAKEKGQEIETVKYPWSASGRASSMGLNTGLTKLILDPQSGRVLGGGIVGENAGSLISEVALAVEMCATAEDIALTIHPHPTLSETIMEAAETFFGNATHLSPRKK